MPTLATFLIDPPSVVLAGLVFACFELIGRDGRPVRTGAVFGPGLLLCSGIFATALASYYVAPDWMFMYYLEQRPEGFFAFAFIGLGIYYIPFLAGLFAGRALRLRSPLLLMLTMVFFVFVQAGVIAATWQRYRVVGPLADWRAGVGDLTPLYSHRKLVAISALGPGSMVLFAFLFVGRRLRRRPRLIMAGEIPRHGIAPGQRLIANYLAESLFPSAREERLAAALAVPPPRAPEPDAGSWLNDFVLSLPLASQFALGAALDMVECLPILVIGRPLPFTRLSVEARDRYVRKLDRISFSPVAFAFLSHRTVHSIHRFDSPARLAQLGIDHRFQAVSGRPAPFPLEAPVEVPLIESPSARLRRGASPAGGEGPGP